MLIYRSEFLNVATIPDETACLALLEKYHCPDHIIEHSKAVWGVARIIGEGLIRKEHPIDMALLKASCLLHDIAKYPCLVEKKGWHDVVGAEMLKEEGLAAIADIVAQHVRLTDRADSDIKEEHVLFYADKRVVHDRVVTLRERFRYLAETYGRTQELIDKLKIMEDSTFRLEERIFDLLDFSPDDVPTLLENSP
jgi:putative nucleotidyltransferase with HDIG domain